MASKKSLRSGQSMFNDDKKTGSTENTNISKKDAEKTSKKKMKKKRKRLIGKKKGTYLKNTLVKNVH